MTLATRKRGQHGETIAVAILQGKGFQVEALNWHLGRYGELDVVAWKPDGGILVFVEVKTRKGDAFGLPAESVDAGKQAQIHRLAEAYLSQRAGPAPQWCRFDVLSIHFPGHGSPAVIEHLENAF